ncbi:MAG: hypothetical protein ACUVTO_06370 [Candidatus Caldatribacteriaceae bacterium]
MKTIVQVALPVPLFRTFSYSVPPELLESVSLGSAVEVDFHHRLMRGWVIEWGGEEVPGLKDIGSVLPLPPLSSSVLCFMQRLSLLYLVPLGMVIDSFFPPLGKVPRKYMGFRVAEGKEAALFRKQFGALPSWGMNLFLFREKFRLPEKVFRGFLKKGLLCLQEEKWGREEAPLGKGEFWFWEIPHAKERQMFVLELLERLRNENRKALLLFPDFRSEDNFLSFLSALLPSPALVRYDSRLSLKERICAFLRIVEGDFQVIVGTRLAAFTLPCQDLAYLVLFDPEEKGYISDKSPHYDAVEVLKERVRHFGGRMDVVCAVPSLRMYFYWTSGVFQKGERPKYWEKRKQAIQGVVARREWKRFALFPPTRRAMTSIARSGGVAVVWVQKTGYATALGCRECGFYFRCPSCGVALRYHWDETLLICPLCGFRRMPENTCPSCGGIQWENWGQGVERVFEETKTLFPEVKVERVDPEAQEEGWRGELAVPSILVGTNALLREEVLQRSQLFVIHSLDEWLCLLETNAREEFYLRFQKVLRFLPEDTLVLVQGSRKSLQSVQDFLEPWDDFYKVSLEKRRELMYPPFVQLLRIVVRSRNKECLYEVLSNLRASFAARGVEVMGPFPSIVPRRGRAQSGEILVRYREEDLEKVFLSCKEAFPLPAGVSWSFEFLA